MTTLRYIGRQELPAGMDIDPRMWNIEATDAPELKQYVGSTRMRDGLVELGVLE